MIPKRDYAWFGLIALAAFVAQEVFHLKWGLMADLQRNGVYKQITGVLLVSYIGLQWHLAFLRMMGKNRNAVKAYHFHKYSGVVAPIIFYLHSTTFGYAYLLLLSSVYFANVLLGIFNQEVFYVRNKWITKGWMVMHVFLSVLTVLLAVYHVYVVYLYE